MTNVHYQKLGIVMIPCFCTLTSVWAVNSTVSIALNAAKAEDLFDALTPSVPVLSSRASGIFVMAEPWLVDSLVIMVAGWLEEVAV